MRCKHCGNENPEHHRFCGLCGKPLAEDGRVAPSQANPVRPDVAAGNPAPVREPERSSDVSYLLDEAEQEEPRNWGKIAAVAVTLVVLAGFGYQYFLNGAGQSASKTPASPVAQNSTSAAGEQTPAPSEPAPSQANPSQAAPSQPAASEHGNPAPETSADAVKPKETLAATPVRPAETTSRKERVEKPIAATIVHTAAKPKAAAVTAKSHAKPSAAKSEPTPATHPVADPVTLAEKYVYGDGVTQDCERGMHTLNPLGAAADLRAMVALGALYTTGTCVPRDLPTAYRWFSKALRKDSENQTLQQDMKQLWGQMTAPERQLAIKLSQ